MNKYITIISYSLVLSYLPDTVYAQACNTVPTCSDLGYNRKSTSCPDGVKPIPCPFDNSYIFCPRDCRTYTLPQNECDSSIGICEQCSDTTKWRYVSCNDGWYKRDDRCVENDCYGYTPEQPDITGCSKINTCKKANQTYYENICSICETGYELKDGKCKKIYNIGDIYYYNNTSIGVVFYDDDTITKIISLNNITTTGAETTSTPEFSWTTSSSSDYYDIPNLTNYTSNSDARKDMNGKSNTNIILSYAKANNKTVQAATATSKYAPSICSSGSMCGAGEWYLPASGEFHLVFNNLSTIQSALSSAGGTQFSTNTSACFWNSSEYSDIEVWCFRFTNGLSIQSANKYTINPVRPCLEIAK